MGRHIEGNNLLLLAEILEVNRVMALMAVDYQQLMRTHRTRLCMLVKVL